MAKSKDAKKKEEMDMNFLLFEVEMHRLLDLLGAPEGRYICKRLKDHLESKGVNTDPDYKAEAQKSRDLTKEDFIGRMVAAGWTEKHATEEYDQMMADAAEEDGYDGP